MASTVSNGNDRSEKWKRPFTKGKFASGIRFHIFAPILGKEFSTKIRSRMLKIEIARCGRSCIMMMYFCR